ncbi:MULTISPECIES: CsbD family protein [unclassified Enterococcus]|uniref:CsbD family protein n=1 Tax=unclassified Enterococcus TaxID=2608891 RepID=UPI0013ECE33A|nr:MULTISPECIES: CsbD family protein [unclassified Enterococcus]
MADLKGRSEDMKDKVVGEGKKAYGKATDDKSKETEGKAQSLGADVKEKARDLGDDMKKGFEDVKEKFSRKDDKK